MAIFSNVEHLKMWVHKILPLVYDDSMSYYETLCKVVAKLNEVVTLSNEQTDYLNNWLTTTEESLESWKSDTEDALENKITTDLGEAINRLESEFADELLDAEGMIYGTQNDVPVEEESEYYQNNAEYFRDESKNYANGGSVHPSQFMFNNAKYFRERSEAWANGEIYGEDVTSQDEAYENNGKYYMERSQAWANGKIYGQDVPSGDEAYENNAKYYAEQAREAALTFVPDPTLTEANRPAEAKATGDAIADLKSAISDIDDTIYRPEEFDMSSLTPIMWTISNINKWVKVQSGDQRGYLIDISTFHNPRKIKITANNSYPAIFGFLTVFEPVNGEDVVYADGYTSRISLPAGTSAEYTLTDNINYVYVNYLDSSAYDHTPLVDIIYADTDKTLSESNIPADSKTVGEHITAINNALSKTYDDGTVNFDLLPQTGWGISPIGEWTSSSIAKSYTFKIPKTAQKIAVTGSSGGSIIAFLKTFKPVAHESADFSSTYPSRIIVSANTTVNYTVSGDMNYLFVLLKNTSGTDLAPTVNITASGTTVYAIDTESVDESEKTDVTSEIDVMTNAFGECKLTAGVYYVSGLHLPASAKLIGSGTQTIIKLLASIASGSTISMGANSMIKDLTIKGADSTKWSEVSEGTRNGIEWTGETQTAGVVDSCTIINFDGSGIYLHDTTQKTYRNLHISNCYITGNYIGIDIRKDSEFNKIVNCTIIGNNIGYRNRGGNNDIANSGIDANKTGILIDADVGTNNGHGTITGCSINHSNSNTGYGIIIKDTGRMLITNCNLYFSKLKLDTTNGNVISNCGFGTSADWEISSGSCSLFIGCMVRGWDSENTPVTITNNTDVKIINCYDRFGVLYT